MAKLEDKNSPDQKNESKILIIGLNNAGKSCILLSLKGEKNLMNYSNIKPTKKIKIEEIIHSEHNYYIWDFGGQKGYREEYIRKIQSQKSNYFFNVSKIIFVIDVQDISSYDIALEYLKLVLDGAKEENHDIKYSVFIHKLDPDIKHLLEYSDAHLKTVLIDRISEIFGETPYELFKTTIFTVFQKSIFY